VRLRQRIALWYGAVLLLAVLVVGGWAFVELQERAEAQVPDVEEVGETALDEALEIFLFGALPALLLGLIGGAIVTRRALRPLSQLAQELERTHVGNLAAQLPRTGNGDEIDRLTMVFNSLKQRLAESFDHAREFTLHASHELKSPLTIMHGTLERMMQPSDLSPELRERCGMLVEEVQRLSGIVSQLTFLAKADAGQAALNKTEVALHELVAEAVEDAELLAAHSGIKVELDTVEPAKLVADRMRLRQLLLIVLDNAIKHNLPAGWVRVGLGTRGDKVELGVINTGPPIAQTDRGRVFERFYRGEAARTARVDGSGLGLSIAEQIVHSHGGTIGLEEVSPGQHRCVILLPTGLA
jgi:signal transduction histidine kinase